MITNFFINSSMIIISAMIEFRGKKTVIYFYNLVWMELDTNFKLTIEYTLYPLFFAIIYYHLFRDLCHIAIYEIRRNYVLFSMKKTFKIAKIDWCKFKMLHIFQIIVNFVTSDEKQQPDIRYQIFRSFNKCVSL